MAIVADKPGTIEWARQVMDLGGEFRPDAHTISRIEGDTIRAVVVFDTFSRCDCSIHIASDGTKRWMTRELAAETFYYPFVTCGLQRLTGLVASKNLDALRYDQRLGFEVEGMMREALPDDDIIILGMLRRNCRFIPRRYRT